MDDLTPDERQTRRDANFRDARHGVAIVIFLAIVCVILLAYLNS